jgi:hypothetical protein
MSFLVALGKDSSRPNLSSGGALSHSAPPSVAGCRPRLVRTPDPIMIRSPRARDTYSRPSSRCHPARSWFACSAGFSAPASPARGGVQPAAPARFFGRGGLRVRSSNARRWQRLPRWADFSKIVTLCARRARSRSPDALSRRRSACSWRACSAGSWTGLTRPRRRRRFSGPRSRNGGGYRAGSPSGNLFPGASNASASMRRGTAMVRIRSSGKRRAVG